jgi:hypothetical protein
VQAKTSYPMDGWGWEEDSDEVPVHVRAQVLWEMMVRGATVGFVVVKFIRSWVTRTYQIEMDDRARAEIAWMVAEAELFVKRLETLDAPPVDWFPATTETLRRVYDGIEDTTVRVPWRMAQRYRAAIKASKLADQRKGLVVNQMLDRAGTAGTIVTRDPDTGRTIRVATRTASPMPGRTMKAIPRVHRMNPCGWAKGPRP